MHGIQRRGGAGRRIFQPLLCLLLACALLSRFSSASAEYGADFDYLHTINPDIAGWLYSEDGLIDQAVLQAAVTSAEQALAETAAKFGAYCRKIADNILHSAHDAEECENDTWLAAWNSMPTNRPARLAPYLGRITRNLALDRFDKASAQKRGSGQTCAPLDELAECVAAPGGVEDSFDAAETGRIISDFLRTLPEETRNIFLRRYWYCDATADIAARYGLTESKVRVTLHRTRGKLAAYLQERGAAL